MKNKTYRGLPDGMESIIRRGEYRAIDDLFYSIWFGSDVYGCVIGDGDNGCYDFVLAQFEKDAKGKWTIVKQSDCAYGSTHYALRDLVTAYEQHYEPEESIKKPVGMPSANHGCWFDEQTGRYVLEGKDLHCGDCFQIREKADLPWIDVRIEIQGQQQWYLVGVPAGCSTEPDAYEARLYRKEVAK